MIKVNIVNEVTGREYQGVFDSVEEATAWKNLCLSKNSWGKSRRFIKTEELPPELSSRILSTEDRLEGEVNVNYSEVKDDFVITEVDEESDQDFKRELNEGRRKKIMENIDDIIIALLEREDGKPGKLNAIMAKYRKLKTDHPVS